jgi:7-cyano-7-deazaguanine synthase
MKTLVICSGGLDSVTLTYKIARSNTHALTSLVSFDYGQRHKKELDFAARAAKTLDVPHEIIDISGIGAKLSGSALTDDVDVPDGHYAQETMKATIVPNRNAIMLTIAYGMAAAKHANAVATAVHGGDHFIYPDCRPDFIHAFEKMQNQALDGYANIALYTPYLNKTKSDIAADGALLNVPFVDTWSCYKGGEHHCGRCGTCVERREAFDLAGVNDPTKYDDPDYWVSAVEDAKKRGAA